MIQLSVHPSQYPDAAAAGLWAAVEAKHLPSRLLYDSFAQSRRWLDYHEAFSPARTRSTVQDLYPAIWQRALAETPGEVELWSLGSGGGQKDLQLLRQSPGRVRRYVPMDTSPTLALTSALAAQGTVLRVQPWVVDLAATVDPEGFSEPPSVPRLVAAFGLIPNFELEDFGPRLRDWLRPQDCLLVSFNLSPGPFDEAVPRILPQYDNPPARAWLAGALRELGWELHGSELRIDARSLVDDGRRWRIEAWAEAGGRTRRLEVAGRTLSMEPQDRLRCLISNRMTADAVPELLREWGLQGSACAVDDGGEEGVWLARRA